MNGNKLKAYLRRIFIEEPNLDGGKAQALLSRIASLSATLLGLLMATIALVVGQGLKLTERGKSNLRISGFLLIISIIVSLGGMLLISDEDESTKKWFPIVVFIVFFIFIMGILFTFSGLLWPLIEMLPTS